MRAGSASLLCRMDYGVPNEIFMIEHSLEASYVSIVIEFALAAKTSILSHVSYRSTVIELALAART